MAFAVTDANFDTHIIPESYIQLRDIPRLPFGLGLMQPEKTAGVFSKKCPIALVENVCVIVTGKTLLEAFDRLEVAEFTAKALISANSISEPAPINEEKIAEIIKAFNLDT